MHGAPRIRIGLVLAALLAAGQTVATTWETPRAFLLALAPLAYTLPIFAWLDRLEPEPREARWNALLWGAGVSVLVALIVNEATTLAAGPVVAAVVSAPLIEEFLKVAGIASMAKRHLVDSPLDGAVYAGYIGLGFAAVENIVYFSEAILSDDLSTVFVFRGLLSPLAHPYFSAWAGLEIGRALYRGTSRRWAMLRGLGVAIPLHSTWNAASLSSPLALLMLCHVALFVVLIVRLRRMQRHEAVAVRRRLPDLAFEFDLSPVELTTFGDHRTIRRIRRGLPRADRRAFDERRVAVTKAALRVGHS